MTGNPSNLIRIIPAKGFEMLPKHPAIALPSTAIGRGTRAERF